MKLFLFAFSERLLAAGPLFSSCKITDIYRITQEIGKKRVILRENEEITIIQAEFRKAICSKDKWH